MINTRQESGKLGTGHDVLHSYRQRGTKGVMVLENRSSAANPALGIMEPGARPSKTNPATAYAAKLGA